MVEPPTPGDTSAGGPAQEMRRNYALAAAQALVQYIAAGFRFAIRTVEPGERIAPAGEAKRVVFTLPDWNAYIAFLNTNFNAWWLRTRGR